MTDYEDGMRLAIRKHWPNVEIRGCFFHYCRAILRKCRKLGMKKSLKNCADARRIKRSLMSLPLLPGDNIKEGYDCIKVFAQKSKLFSKFSRLFAYFEGYWIHQVNSYIY